MNFLKLAAAAPLALALSLTTAAEASNYPPDYNLCGDRDTLTSGPFEFIRDTVDTYDGHARLTVAYRGQLRNVCADDQINFYVRLNGNDAFLEANPGSNGDAYIFLDSGPRACVFCYPGSYYSACDGISYPYNSGGHWVCSDPTPTEEHLFFWAFNENGDQNAWDIDVAAECNGQWDSNWGSNYAVRFEPRLSCW
jgi:hypothetical protein